MPLFSRTVLIISWIFISLKVVPVTSRPSRNELDRCPLNESEWSERAAGMFCQGSDSYHCFLTENKLSVKETCIEKTLILEGFCPIFTDDGYLHWISCNDTACPNSPYRSDEVHKYQICYKKSGDPTTKDSELKNEDSDTLTYGLIGGVVAVVIACIIGAVYFYLHRNSKVPREQIEDEDIANGYNVLKRSNILYIIGQLGNSVSTVGKRIAKRYADEKKLKFVELNYLDISANLEGHTVYFVDGWFGLWDNNICERALVEENHKLILKNRTNENHIKFVVGLRSGVENLFKPFSFPKNDTIRRDSSSTGKEQIITKHLEEIRGNCNKMECPCKAISVSDILSIEGLGTHLILKLIELDHSLAEPMVDEGKGPAIALTEHFTSLKSRDKDLFGCIFYLVLNGFYNKDSVRNDIAEHISMSKEKLENEKLELYTRQKSKLATTWSSKITNKEGDTCGGLVFWHNFLYICAFRACYNSDPEKVMQNCNVDAILQLVRPVEHERESDFTVEADIHLISLFNEKRIKGTDFESHVVDHPLLKDLRKKADGNE